MRREEIYSMKDNHIQFVTLDTLRGIAAIAVATFHFVGGFKGYLAVDFFLVLSGFILSHSYLYKKPKTSTISFISHRIARLYPLHIFTLFTYTITTLLVYKQFPTYTDGTLFTFFQHITLTQNIGLSPTEITWNHPSWSISVEFWVNIIFIFFISSKTQNRTLFIWSLIGFMIIYHNTGHLDTHSLNYYHFLNSGMVRGLSSFFLGILSYRIFLHYKNDHTIKKYTNVAEALCLIGGLLFFFGNIGSIEILAPFFFMIAITIFAFEAGYLSQFLNKFPYLGKISYSIYLNQMTIILIINSLLTAFNIKKVWILLPYLLTLIIYAHFTYIYIEKPLRNRGRECLSRLTHTTTQTT